jgi:hypothetical protein
MAAPPAPINLSLKQHKDKAMKIDHTAAIERLTEIADDYGSLYEQYSGRAMYGAHCVGIVTSAPKIVIELAVASSITGHRTDSMGRDSIVYWPHIQMPVPAKPDTPSPVELAREQLTSYLRGYGRTNPACLLELASRNQWSVHATAVLDQRQYKLLESLDDSVLLEIECGTIDVREIATQVAAELKAGKGEGSRRG